MNKIFLIFLILPATIFSQIKVKVKKINNGSFEIIGRENGKIKYITRISNGVQHGISEKWYDSDYENPALHERKIFTFGKLEVFEIYNSETNKIIYKREFDFYGTMIKEWFVISNDYSEYFIIQRSLKNEFTFKFNAIYKTGRDTFIQ